MQRNIALNLNEKSPNSIHILEKRMSMDFVICTAPSIMLWWAHHFLLPALSEKYARGEGALRKMVSEGEIKREGAGKDTFKNKAGLK